MLSRCEYIKELDYKKDKCFKCGNLIKKNVYYIHVNIYNNPFIKFFCSNECKLAWIFKKLKIKKKKKRDM